MGDALIPRIPRGHAMGDALTIIESLLLEQAIISRAEKIHPSRFSWHAASCLRVAATSELFSHGML